MTCEKDKKTHTALKIWLQFYKKIHDINKERPYRATPSQENLSKERKGKHFKLTELSCVLFLIGQKLVHRVLISLHFWEFYLDPSGNC